MRKKLLLTAALLTASVGQASSGIEPFIGEVQTVAFDLCPKGWAPMNGQLLSISQNTALFSMLGTRYGGNGVTTFALPVAKPVYSASGAPLLQCIALQGIFPSHN